MDDVQKYEHNQGRNDLAAVNEYATLVKRIAHHLLGRLPPSVLLDDLVQAGMIGLIEASRNYDESKGASFNTYAGIRIRGSMLDEIRKGDWAPRSVHRNSRMIQKAIHQIENETGRDAKDVDVASSLGLEIDDYHKILQDTNGARILAFEDLGISEDIIGSKSTRGPQEDIQKQDFKVRLGVELGKLPKREQLVLTLYYDEELNLREVGEVLGVSESRISQIHSQAMHRLQARVKEWQNAI